AVGRTAELTRLDRKGVNTVGIDRMHQHGKTEIAWQAVRDALPGVPAIVGAVQPGMILQEEPLGPRPVKHHLVDALSELRILFRLNPHRKPGVTPFPCPPPSVGPVPSTR